MEAKHLKNKSKGFTLIELVIVIALLAITAGVSADIITTLVRSYSKTKLINEMELAGGNVLTKISKEVKSSNGVYQIDDFYDSSNVPVCGNTISFYKPNSEGDVVKTVYSVDTGTGEVTKINDPDGVNVVSSLLDPADSGSIVVDTNSATNGGIGTDFFCWINAAPNVIYMRLPLKQAGSGVGVTNQISITVEETIVVRGGY